MFQIRTIFRLTKDRCWFELVVENDDDDYTWYRRFAVLRLTADETDKVRYRSGLLLVQQRSDFLGPDSPGLAVFHDDGVLSRATFGFERLRDRFQKTGFHLLTGDFDVVHG